MTIEKITIHPEPLRASDAPGVPASTAKPTAAQASSFENALATEAAPYSRMLKRGESASRQTPHTMATDNDFSLFDFLDIINPLQHIPVVSTLYREITGDTIKPGLQMAGSVMFGGVIGAIASLANGVVQTETGRDIGGNIMLALRGSEPTAPQTAQASPPTLPPKAPIEVSALPVPTPDKTKEDQALLSLYGQQASAHASYNQANMRQYLADVTHSAQM